MNIVNLFITHLILFLWKNTQKSVSNHEGENLLAFYILFFFWFLCGAIELRICSLKALSMFSGVKSGCSMMTLRSIFISNVVNVHKYCSSFIAKLNDEANMRSVESIDR